ncbi:creatininase family protein [Arthrobacter sp. StoSoilB5]|uniref:creatininase family protein n=1 Tax=Arthrobacter sp. StoSoilB5 TaxID=2830992 RepID=UPI001CC4E077|nr:creatininase family protein [Arthrobacter sp. StoSoilB5]BCW44897.1 creatinine amidohydrolase [Arthrobacter sp. StoSoilB5]
MTEPNTAASRLVGARPEPGGPRLLGSMSWTEAAEVAKENPVVLLPIGAIEQHGPHLPLDEDALIADHVAREISSATGAVVAPTLPYGHSHNLRGYTGTISLPQRVLTDVVVSIGSELARHGFKRIVLVDGNGGNLGATAEAAYILRDRFGILVGRLYPWGLGYSLMRDAYKDPDKVYGHGAEPEMSAMMEIFPGEVRLDQLPEPELRPFQGWRPSSYTQALVPPHDLPGEIFWDFSEICPSGVTGDFSESSKDMGKIWVERVIGFCIDYVREYERNTRTADGTTPESLSQPAGCIPAPSLTGNRA